MANKFYAIRKGRVPGVYSTWAEAQKQIHKFPGAVFKSFPTKEEALAFVENQPVRLEKAELLAPDTIEAYVDGSFDRRKGTYGSGIVFIKNGEIIHEISRGGNDPRYIESFQIAGEVFGALGAVKWAKNNGYKRIVIYYDYAGIENWATGMWKINKPISQDYVKYYQYIAADMEVIFQKVKAHTGVEFNEHADQLAKKATQLV